MPSICKTFITATRRVKKPLPIQIFEEKNKKVLNCYKHGWGCNEVRETVESQKLEESVILLWNAELAFAPRTSADPWAWFLTYCCGMGTWGQCLRPDHGHRPDRIPLSKMPQSSNGNNFREWGRKRPCPSEGDLSILAWAHSEAGKKKSLLRISNQKSTHIIIGPEFTLPLWLGRIMTAIAELKMWL